jgi:hypothetical protein
MYEFMYMYSLIFLVYNIGMELLGQMVTLFKCLRKYHAVFQS